MMHFGFITDMFCDGLLSAEDYEWAWKEHLKGVGEDAMARTEGEWVSQSRNRIG